MNVEHQLAAGLHSHSSPPGAAVSAAVHPLMSSTNTHNGYFKSVGAGRLTCLSGVFSYRK